MTPESTLRAQPDSRILDQGGNQLQGSLFDEPQDSNHEQLLADYRQRYGLAEDPFADDYAFPLFTGGGRRELLDRLLHLSQFSNSLLVVLGDYGVGKTRIAHALMDALPEDDGLSYLPISAGQGTDELLKTIVEDLGLSIEGGNATRENLLLTLEQFMQVDQLEDEGLAVIVMDNAHLLQQHCLQTMIGLLQKHPKQNRLHIVLFGESVLMEQLESCNLDDILVSDFYLPALTLGESVDYLNFRMEMADYLGPEIFTESMVSPWWRQAQGQLGILHDFAQERLLESVTPQGSGMPKRGLPVLHIVAISVLITAVGVVFLYMGDDKIQLQSTAKPTVTIVSPPASSSRNLTSTATPVEPLLQTLPGPADTQHVAVAEPAVTAPASAAPAEERIVPSAELSVNNQPATVTPPPVNVEVNAVPKAVESSPVIAQPSVQEKPQPEIEPAKPKPVQDPLDRPLAASKNAQERTILGWPGSYYTIQLLGVSTEKAARDYVADQTNKKELLVFKSKRQGKDWFVVITGHYPSTAQARQAIADLPAAQRDAGPWPREIKVIQQEIKAAF